MKISVTLLFVVLLAFSHVPFNQVEGHSKDIENDVTGVADLVITPSGIFIKRSMMARADDPCKYAVAYVVDQVKYCQCPVHFPNCKNDECDTYCSNTYDYGQTGDATGTCKAANTCLCRFRCP